MPREMIERGLPTCTLLAFVVVSKYLDHLPLNRLQGIFQRQGFGVTHGTMVGWFQRCFDLVKCLVEAWFVDAMHRSRVIGSDATGVLVQDDKRCRRGHFGVFVADAGYVLFKYSDRHTHKEPLKFFEDFDDVALVDAAPVFNRMFDAEDGPTEAGCWAIASHSELALVGIGDCNRLFGFERHLTELAPERRLEERQRICRPIVEHFSAWLDGLGDSIESGSLMAKARTYFTNQKDALHTFLGDGRVKIHNNGSELNLRSVVVGRANWPFVGDNGGGERHAAYQSIVMTAKTQGLEPQQYVRDLFRVLPHWPKTRLVELAPHRWSETRARLDERELDLELGPLTVPPSLECRPDGLRRAAS